MIKGSEELFNKLNSLPDLTEVLTKAALIVESEAKKKVPVNDGILRASINSQVSTDKAIIGSNLDYAPYVEYGTGVWAKNGNGRKTRWKYKDEQGNWHSSIGQHPQPFLNPALDNNRKKIEKLINDDIRGKLKI